jgi:hypothetical protein
MKKAILSFLPCLLCSVLLLSSCFKVVPDTSTAPATEPPHTSTLVTDSPPTTKTTPAQIITPAPSSEAVATTSNDSWGQWGPLKWPEEFKPTAGAYLEFIKKEEKTIDGKPAIIYYLTAVGLPKDTVYQLWVKSLSNQTPTAIVTEAKIDDSGYVMIGGERFNLGIQAPVKGEAMELGLMTVDKNGGALGKIIPFPIESKQGNYRLWVELRSKNGDLFVIYGEGFEPNKEMSFVSTSDGEVAKGTIKANDKGRLNIVVLPAVAGKESGLASYSVIGKYGEVEVSYEWGPAATKTVSLTPTPTPTPTQTYNLPSMNEFMKGIWFNDWGWQFDSPRPPEYGPLFHPPQADTSFKSLATTGANWISVVVGIFQETVSSTNITSNQYKTASDNALRHVIDLAHSVGIRVVLVPCVTLSNDPDHSWVQIGSAFTSETQWQQWFTSYREHINHYASLAQEAGADMLYVGSELPGTTHREDDWRRVIKEVRERFKGPISYDSVFWGNPTAEYKRIKFWDALDYVATDFWFSLTNKNNPTVEELKQGWLNTGWLNGLEYISIQFKKPAILSEIGYDSHDGTARNPDGEKIQGAPEDFQEQADCYQAALEMVMGRPWLKGIFWWQWNAISIPSPWPGDPHGKLAEEVLRKYYLGENK